MIGRHRRRRDWDKRAEGMLIAAAIFAGAYFLTFQIL